jgi:acid phosphatase family membrane protein YuiD
MYNPYIVVPLAVWAITQLLKFTVATFRGTIDFRNLYASGGMPSVHSAVVMSLATTALILDGSGSHLFGLTAVLAAIVMYDSFGVRRSSGEQAAALNMVIASLGEGKVRLQNPGLKLREVLGHKPSEVAVGALLGAFLAALFNLNSLSAQLTWLQGSVAGVERMVYVVIFAFLVVGGWLTRIIASKRRPGSKAVGSFAKAILIKTQVIGWIGLVLALAQYENLGYLTWRVWPIAVLVALVVWDAWLFPHYMKKLPVELEAEQEQQRKGKWLRFKKKKK